jgi:hypothetical protein
MKTARKNKGMAKYVNPLLMDLKSHIHIVLKKEIKLYVGGNCRA